MKLIDRIRELNKDELVYIGSKSAYFFIGYPDDFLKNEKKLTREWFNKFSDAYSRAERAIELHNMNKPEVGKDKVNKVQNLRTRQIEEVVIPYETLLKNWETRDKALQQTLKSASKAMDRFKSFPERNIIEEYHRIDPNDGTVLIVKGYEVGNFWFYKDTFKKNVVIDNEESEE